MRTFDTQRDGSSLDTQHIGATINLSSNIDVQGFFSRLWLRAEAESTGNPIAGMHYAVIKPSDNKLCSLKLLCLRLRSDRHLE